MFAIDEGQVKRCDGGIGRGHFPVRLAIQGDHQFCRQAIIQFRSKFRRDDQIAIKIAFVSADVRQSTTDAGGAADIGQGNAIIEFPAIDKKGACRQRIVVLVWGDKTGIMQGRGVVVDLKTACTCIVCAQPEVPGVSKIGCSAVHHGTGDDLAGGVRLAILPMTRALPNHAITQNRLRLGMDARTWSNGGISGKT